MKRKYNIQVESDGEMLTFPSITYACEKLRFSYQIVARGMRGLKEGESYEYKPKHKTKGTFVISKVKNV